MELSNSPYIHVLLFVPIFTFCRIKLIFGRQTVFVFVIVFLDLASFLSNNVCKKLSFPKASSRDLLSDEKQTKPFFLVNDEITKVWYLPLVVRTNASFIIQGFQ